MKNPIDLEEVKMMQSKTLKLSSRIDGKSSRTHTTIGFFTLHSSFFTLHFSLFTLRSSLKKLNLMDGNKYNRGKSPLHVKSFDFAVRIIGMVKHVDYPIKISSCFNQILRSGTAIGALVREAEFAQSPSDFINKLHVALKECNETSYWLELFHETELINDIEFDSMIEDCNELTAILISSIKTSKERYKK